MATQKTAISTHTAPGAIAPYSQAIQAGNLVYTSGQIAIDPQTGSLAGDSIEVQTHQVLGNIRNLLQAAGSDLNRVVKTTVFLASMDDFKAMNAIYATYFQDGVRPARSTVEVSRLPLDVRIEIDCIALCD